MQKAPEPGTAAARGWRRELVAGKALQKAAAGDTTLQPCQAQPGTLVNAKAERQVPVGRLPQALITACELQPVGVDKVGGVAVRCPNAQGQQATDGQRHTTNGAGLEGAAVAELVGRLKTQKFINCKG